MATATKKATKAGATKQRRAKREPAAKKSATTGAAKSKAAKDEPATKKKVGTKGGAAAKPATAKKSAKRDAAAKPAASKQPTAAELASASGGPPDLPALLRIRDALRAYAFGLPGAWEDHPWGESVAKVGKKVFVFFGTADPAHLRDGVGMSVKLPHSGDLVLALPFAQPTGYGLGRSGWVSVRLQPADLPPMPMLTAWIDESYRSVAPKKRVAELDSRRP